MVKNDFETFYKNLDYRKMKDAWTERYITEKRENKKNNIIILILDIIIAIVFYKAFYMMEVRDFEFTIFIILGYLFVTLFVDAIVTTPIGNFKNSKYNNSYKEEVIDKILKNFFEEVDYIPKKGMPQNIYDEWKNGNNDDYYEDYYSDDYMEGMTDDKYPIKMADILLQMTVTSTNSDGEKTTEVVTLFSGLFAKIDMKKSIEGELVIKQDGHITGKEKLEMDSREFEKYFDVSSSDKIKGMQLLTHDIMELLTVFRTKYNIQYDIAIKNNYLYIRLHTGNMFESKFNDKEVIDKNITKKYYDIVDFIYSLAKEMIKNVEQAEL